MLKCVEWARMTPTVGQFEEGEVVLVTAGASGIGRCIATTFLAHGSRVHVCDIDPDILAGFLADHPDASGSIADVANLEQVDNMFGELTDRYGRLDILVNNAGVAGPTAPVEEIGIADWDRTIAIDLSGQFYVTRRAVPLLKQSGRGSIINVSSNAALFGCPLRSPYVASKWAMIGLTKTWAMELGRDNIRVNALCPGSVEGERIDGVITRDAEQRNLDPSEVREIYQRQSSMRLFVSAQDVANMALFLGSDLGASISGQAIGIDGHTEGLSSHWN
jgi:NAD(P)-dependent dehydrogenase (short-subunit alcohol dehydrogenase family)